MRCLDGLLSEFDKLEMETKACPWQNGSEKLTAFATWARETTNAVRSSIMDGGKGMVRYSQPPQWDLGILSVRQDANGPAAAAQAGPPPQVKLKCAKKWKKSMRRRCTSYVASWRARSV